MREVVIVDAVRTAIGKKKGALSSVHPVDLLVPVLRALVDRNGLDAGLVEDVIVGCVTMTGEQGGNIARQAVLAAGFPVGVPAFSLNRMCGSSQQAIHSAAQAILAGDIDIAIAAGVESMTRVPMGSDMGRFSRQLTSRYNIVPQGISAEMIAKKWGVSREELDAFSLQSHEKAAAATDRGMFEREIIPLDVPGEEGTVSFTRDEGIRRDTSLEKLAALKPSFQPKDGVITAGNSSQVSDGAAGVLLMSAEKAAALGLR
ncbi:thiolase family protein, partial [Anoxybacillus geothermalis]|nr:thiolase family protein [Anoxybacillus geothermalis]